MDQLVALVQRRGKLRSVVPPAVPPISALAATVHCDKADKSTFAECLGKAFPAGADIAKIEAFLHGEGFVAAKDSPPTQRYFRWSSNNLANYVVAVTVEAEPGGAIQAIIVY